MDGFDSVLSGIIVGAIGSAVLVTALRRFARHSSQIGNRECRANWPLIASMWFGTALFAAMAVFVAVDSQAFDGAPMLQNGIAAFFLVAALGCAITAYDCQTRYFWWDADGLSYTKWGHQHRHMRWSHITKLDYLWGIDMWRIEFTDGSRVGVYAIFPGASALLDYARSASGTQIS